MDSVRAELHHKKRINIFERLVHHPLSERRADHRRRKLAAPRIREHRCSVLDGVVVGNLLISLLKQTDRAPRQWLSS